MTASCLINKNNSDNGPNKIRLINKIINKIICGVDEEHDGYVGKIFCVIFVMLMIGYINLSPSLQLKHPPDNKTMKFSCEQQKLAETDLKEKVYPEIKARLSENNEWLFRKFTLAGGLLSAFLIQIWLHISQKKKVDDMLNEFFNSKATCAVLGLACIVAMFIDLQCRRSEMIMQQLGSWAAYYGALAIGGGNAGTVNEFMGWEQFLRTPGPHGAPMHQNFVDAFQIGNLNLVTVILFGMYYWAFLRNCCTGLGWFNKGINCLVLFVLLIFVSGAHLTSGNFVFTNYFKENQCMLWRFIGRCISEFKFYFAGWYAVLIAFALGWDVDSGRPDQKTEGEIQSEAAESQMTKESENKNLCATD